MFGILILQKWKFLLTRNEKRNTVPCLPFWSEFTSSQECDPDPAEWQSTDCSSHAPFRFSHSTLSPCLGGHVSLPVDC